MQRCTHFSPVLFATHMMALANTNMRRLAFGRVDIRNHRRRSS
jgi:hypothetical protein